MLRAGPQVAIWHKLASYLHDSRTACAEKHGCSGVSKLQPRAGASLIRRLRIQIGKRAVPDQRKIPLSLSKITSALLDGTEQGAALLFPSSSLGPVQHCRTSANQSTRGEAVAIEMRHGTII